MTNVSHPLPGQLAGWWGSCRRPVAPNGEQLWTMVLGQDACSISVYRFSLRFLDPCLENGFANSRFDRLVKSAATLTEVITLTCAVAISSFWYRFGLPWDQNPPAMMHWGVLVIGVCTGLAQSIIMRRPCIMGKMSTLGVEVCCAVTTVLMFLGAFLLSPHYGRRLLGYGISDIPGTFVGGVTDMRPLLSMQLFLLGSHFLVVARWHVLLVTELTPVLLYMVFAGTLGSPEGEDPLENLIILLCTTMVVGLSKRTMEYSERLLFFNMIQ